ncbi:MAG: hypothetical protein V4735_09930 [Pseudomonadota bacterium]
MPAPTRSVITIYDHPESKIRFLETALMGKDWRARVLFADSDPASPQHLAATRELLQARGYAVAAGHDEHGNSTLEIHHFGAQSALSDVLHEAGLLRGTAHAITHPADTLGKGLVAAKKSALWLEGSLRDPARANGVINSTAEVFLTTASAGAQYGKFTDPKNALLSIAGLGFLAQSVTYLGFARNNEDRAFQRIGGKIDQAIAANDDLGALRYDPARDAASDSFGERAGRFMKRYPVQIGAMANNFGMLAYIGHAVLERKFCRSRLLANPHDAAALRYVGTGATGAMAWLKTGFGKDIFGASLSFAGWSALMIPPSAPAPECDQPLDRNPLQKTWHAFREHTPFVAGLLTLGASSFRLMGANSKGNVRQQIGEKIYIGGDVALMFTNSHAYGGDAKINPEKLAARITQHVAEQPVLMGAREQTQFVDHIMQFWLDKHTADAAMDRSPPAASRGAAEQNAQDIKQAVMRTIRHHQTERLERLGACAAKIIMRFPDAQQAPMVEAMASALQTMPWMKAGRGEIKASIAAALRPVAANDAPLAPLSQSGIARDVATLLEVVPHIDAPAATSALYDTLAPFMQPRHPQPTTQVHAVAHRSNIQPSPLLAKA